MAKRGKYDENEWLRRCREVTGWTKDEAHRHDAEERASEKGVGDFVLPAPVVVQLRAMKTPRPWEALRDAEAAAEGTDKWAVAGLVVKRGGGRGGKQYRLAGMRVMDVLSLQAETGVKVIPVAAERHGLEAAYEEVLEGLERETGEMGSYGFRLRKRGGDEQMVVIEERRFHEMLRAGWGRSEEEAG